MDGVLSGVTYAASELPEVPTRATMGAVLAATVTRWTLRVLTSVIPTNRPGVWFGRRLIDLDHPRLRLDFAGAHQLPPVLVQVGDLEMLSADARYLDAEIRRAGGSSTLELWPGMVHVFQALPRLAPEAKPALRRAAAFISEVYDDKRSDELEEAK